MGKKIFGIYLAKLDAPNSEAHARLELPASPLELHDAMDKVQLQENEELYLEIDDYYGFEYLAPHLMELDASLNELNDLAGRLAVLDETEQEAFDGLLRLEIQRKVESNGSILTMQDLGTGRSIRRCVRDAGLWQNRQSPAYRRKRHIHTERLCGEAQ